MNDFEEFKSIYNIVIITIATILTSFITNYFQSKIDKKISTLFALILACIFAILSNYFLENLINNNQDFRQWIDPDNFIEGYYYDSTIESGKLKHAVIIRISYNKGSYVVTGETFDNSSKHIATFKSTKCVYAERILFMTFESYNLENIIEQGVDQLQFSLPPNSYSGFYLGYNDNSKIHFISGKKVKDTELRKFNNFEDVADKSKFLSQNILSIAR